MATGQATDRRWTEEDGQPQRLTEETNTKPGRRCNYWCVAGLLFLIGVVGVVVVLCLYLASCYRLQYGIVVDAGSSHSEVSLFRWRGEKLQGTGEVIQLTDCAVDGPGISSYGDEGKPEGAGESLTDCLNEAERKVPVDRQKITPIYLGATAGMRILQQAKPETADAVFNSVRKAFGETNFKIPDNNVRIVRDEEEGLYAWIAANLIQETLGQKGSKVPTTGALDMGGASTQIAFETTERKASAADSDYITLRLYGQDFTVFTHSYLCFGQNEAIKRAKAQLVLNTGATRTFDHPCLHKGFEIKMKVEELFYQTCTIPLPDKLAGLNNNTEITFRGTADISGCYALLDDILNPTKCHSEGYKYCYDHDFIPETKGKFFAFSSFYYTAKYIKGDKTSSLDDYKANAESYCALPWNDVKTQGEKNKQPEVRLSAFCITGLFTAKVIGGIYNLGGDKWNNVKFVKKVEGVSMGWSLGFMTNSTNAIPTEKSAGIEEGVFIGLLIVFIVLILVVLILSYRAWTTRRGRGLGKDSEDHPIVSLCCTRTY